MSSITSNKGYHAGKILARRLLSPTVVELELEVSSEVTFRPGQWIDFVVPPYDWIGGFSMTSLPRELPKLKFAVKKSRHPPSQWIHSEESKEIGRNVQVQVGGNCVLRQDNLNVNQPVVFCAGGIGISPLFSMYKYWTEVQNQRPDNEVKPSASFLYSVSTEDELVFGEELSDLAANNIENHNLVLSLTQQSSWKNSSSCQLQNVQYATGRYMKKFLQSADPSSAFYICGPPAMLDEGVDFLKQRGIDKSNIHYEKWW